MLEERRNLLLLIADHAARDGQATVANGNKKHALAMEKHIGQLKLLLSKLTEDLLPAAGSVE